MHLVRYNWAARPVKIVEYIFNWKQSIKSLLKMLSKADKIGETTEWLMEGIFYLYRVIYDQEVHVF